MNYSYHPYPIVGLAKVAFGMFLITFLALLFLDWTLSAALVPLIWIVSAIFAAMILIKSRVEKITLEDKAVSYQQGILSQRTVMLPYYQITEASYNQGVIQRLFGIGTLRLDTAGGSVVAIHVKDVRSSDLKRTLDEVHEKSGRENLNEKH